MDSRAILLELRRKVAHEYSYSKSFSLDLADDNLGVLKRTYHRGMARAWEIATDFIDKELGALEAGAESEEAEHG